MKAAMDSQQTRATPVRQPAPEGTPVRRITSSALLQEEKTLEIEHGGKIYRLRVTQLNKLILTA